MTTNLKPARATQRVWLRCRDILDRIFPSEEVRIVLDVGARDCGESAEFAAHYPRATVYAFECNPATLPQCRAEAAREPRIVLTENAVSNRAGPLPFFPTDPEKTVSGWPNGNPGASSMFEATGTYPEEKYVQNRIEVEAIRLDDFLASRHVGAIDVLWMDVQGAERLVLEGMGERLRDVKAVHLEAEFFEIYKGQALFGDGDAYLRARGFALIGFTSYSRYSADTLYVRGDILYSSVALHREFPYLKRNLGKLRKHKVKRALRRAVGLPAWPEAKQP
jgi:FkbM family methyltransferase